MLSPIIYDYLISWLGCSYFPGLPWSECTGYTRYQQAARVCSRADTVGWLMRCARGCDWLKYYSWVLRLRICSTTTDQLCCGSELPPRAGSCRVMYLFRTGDIIPVYDSECLISWWLCCYFILPWRDCTDCAWYRQAARVLAEKWTPPGEHAFSVGSEFRVTDTFGTTVLPGMTKRLRLRTWDRSD